MLSFAGNHDVHDDDHDDLFFLDATPFCIV